MSFAQYDVAVIGAGPAGSASAYLLAKGGLCVALLDQFDFPRDKPCGDGLTPRAVKALDTLGILPQIEPRAFRCSAITLRHSDQVTFRLDLGHLAGLPGFILTLPRYTLDDILLRHAMAAGAEFTPHARVEEIGYLEDGRVRLQIAGRPSLDCALAVVAAGADPRLLRRTGLLKATPPANLGARAYFEDVEDLDDTVVLFFDGVDLPGYGWVFPNGPGKANIGCGVFFDGPTSQPAQLRRLLESHPYLQRLLRNARQVGPIKGHLLRTDFSPAHGGDDHILVVGEAVGLVNPITGEGIDYALESAQLAAGAILAGWRCGLAPVVGHACSVTSGRPAGVTRSIQQSYRAALARKYRYQLAVNRLARWVYFRPGALDHLLLRAQDRPNLRRAIVDACFGAADPLVMLTPRTVWEVFGP